MATQIRRWVKRQGEAQRYYEAFVMRDLFQDRFLVLRWGRVGSPRGNSQQIALAQEEEAEEALAKVAKRRAARGYVPCDPVEV